MILLLRFRLEILYSTVQYTSTVAKTRYKKQKAPEQELKKTADTFSYRSSSLFHVLV